MFILLVDRSTCRQVDESERIAHACQTWAILQERMYYKVHDVVSQAAAT